MHLYIIAIHFNDFTEYTECTLYTEYTLTTKKETKVNYVFVVDFIVHLQNVGTHKKNRLKG